MAVNYDTPTKQARLEAVVANIDSGSGPGVLEICTAGYSTVLATITLADPCATVSGGTLTFAGFPRSDTSADASGTAALARVKDSNGTTRIDGLTVGTSGADIILGSTTITAGNEVQLTSAVINHG
jgi:hypothetical protein